MTTIRRHLKSIYILDVVMMVLLVGLVFFESRPEAVNGLKVQESTYSTAVLEWNYSDKAKGYRIYRSVDGNSYEYLTTTTENRFEDKNLETGKKYYYTVASKNGLKTSGINKQKTVKTIPSLETPKLTVDTSKGEVHLNYSEVTGADGYEVFRDSKSIGRTSDLTYVDNEIRNDEPHAYTVRAYRYSDNPVYSKKSNMAEGEMKFIKDFGVEVSLQNISIKWDSSDYDNYKIYDGEKLLTETEGDSFDIPDYDMTHVYDIRLVGFSKENNVQSPTAELNFQVVEEPMDNESALDAVCKWAVEIAEDDSFHYGNGGAAHHNGCYFCGTQPDVKRRNVVQYQKTYCCNPFVQAAFAHGCEDPTMLGLCQRGGSYIEKNYKASSLFDNLGKPDRSSLQKGDVLCCKNGHVMLYVGDGMLCEAANGDDGRDGSRSWRDSISVSELSNNRWNNGSYGVCSVFRYNGQGSGTVRKIKEIEKATENESVDSKTTSKRS